MRLRLAMLAAALTFATTVVPADTARAVTVVDGAGSTWSQIAVDQWRADVARQGLTINYQGVGSTSGRVFYYQGQVDFAVSEIPFQTVQQGGVDEIAAAASRPYAYMPIVAGGTSFMYHLDVNGRRLDDLRLSPDTLAKIFTGVIKNWNDPQITRENRNRPLPSLPIKVVIRSDGSGTSAQFTAFMNKKTPGVWGAFCARARLSPCQPTSLYPNPPGVDFAAQQFSDGVANFVAAPYNNGSITYVEYGYAKERGFPVASVLNKAGYYIQPTAQAVAIALQGARINPDGTQILDGVYDFADNRAYPVSSYSYMIVPTTEKAPFTRQEGDVLGKFILYFLCAGQQKAEQLGYSPLPKNLVEFGFAAERRIPGAPAPPAIQDCSNPTITGDFITGAAPPPPPDDAVDPTATTTTVPGGGPGSGPGSGSASGSTASRSGSGSGSGSGSASAAGACRAAAARAADAFGGGGAGAEELAAATTVPRDDHGGLPVVLYVLVALAALAAVFGPPATAAYLDRRRAQ